MRTTLLLILSFLFVAASFAGTIEGKVTSKATGEPLAGANVYLQGWPIGAATDESGMYSFEAKDGKYVLVCEYVGFAEQKSDVQLAGTVTRNFELVEFLFAKTISVVADRAKERETPVAYSDVSKKQMELTLASQDIPMVLNTTPSVYATMQGGGPGDARINVRGFDQRNVAVMINGMPINDMENGWVYWSNWDGLGDATSSIQIQRGLSATTLATPAIGGSMNIITDPTAQDAGLKLRQEFGNDGFLKTTFTGNTGLVDSKWAMNATVVRKTGDGLIDKTWTDAWAYYFGAAYNINEDNRLELYAMGAPQLHGQNSYKQNIATYDHEFAKSLDDYDQAALEEFPQASSGRKYNQTWGPVSSSYSGQQYWNGSTHDRYASDFIMERANYFHRPLANLNWYSQVSNSVSLYTILYWSGGMGGGSGTFGSLVWDYSLPNSRHIDFDGTIERNRNSSTGSTGILRNSVNNQWTVGAIGKVYWKVNDQVTTNFGVDWRTAEMEHFREVRDLLGGTYYRSSGDSDFWDGPKDLKLGDKFNYYNTNTVDWFGFYGQAEYTSGNLSLTGTAGYSMIKYTFTDHFSEDPDNAGKELYLETNNISGYQIKGGASFRLSEGMDLFGNVGYISKVPIFDAVINDGEGTKAEDPKNETFTHFELGFNHHLMGGKLTYNAGVYYTIWNDRTKSISIQQQDGSEGLVFLTGMDQTHMGFELELAYQPLDILRFDLSGMIADWKHTDDASGRYRDYSSPVDKKFLYAVKDLKVGEQPQMGGTLGITVMPVQGLTLTVIGKYYANHYALWDPFDREVDQNDPNAVPDRVQPWKIPPYAFADLHASYQLPLDWNGIGVNIFAHVLNLFDTVYISDALDNSSFGSYRVDGDIVNPHMADAAEIFIGPPMSFNLGLQLTY